MKLHIGGTEAKPGWQIFNAQGGPIVDFVGDCVDLSQIETSSCEVVYASHVYEHLGYQEDLPRALSEVYRVLTPDGRFLVSVPDLEVLCGLFLSPAVSEQQRFHLMRIFMGGQTDPWDYHKTGFTFAIMESFLGNAGFTGIKRYSAFGLFRDCSALSVFGAPISLNVEAKKAER